MDVDAYALVFAGLLLPAGALGDRFGRRGILLIGLVVFGGAAAAAMFVEAPTTLIALRAVMGIGAALVMPTTLSIITTVFRPEERGKAVGVWAGVAGGGAVIGLLLSGTLLEWFSWPAVFATSVVFAVVAAAATITVVPSSRSSSVVRLDPVGALLSSLGLAALVFSIIEAPHRGWGEALTIGGFAAGCFLLVAFVLFELRRRHPMLDPRLFARRGFGVGSLSLTLQFFAQFGFLFVSLQYLQFVLGYSPLEAGLALLPMALMLMAISPRAPRLAHHLGVRAVGAAGLALMGAGMLVFAALGTDSSYWHFGVGALVTGIGLALATAPATTAIVSSLPSGQQGIGSAVNDLTREVGGAFGIAVLGSILNSTYRSDVSAGVAQLPAPQLRRSRTRSPPLSSSRQPPARNEPRSSSRHKPPSSTGSQQRSSSAVSSSSLPASSSASSRRDAKMSSIQSWWILPERLPGNFPDETNSVYGATFGRARLQAADASELFRQR